MKHTPEDIEFARQCIVAATGAGIDYVPPWSPVVLKLADMLASRSDTQWRPVSQPPEVVADAYCFKDSAEVLAVADSDIFIATLRVWSEEMGGKSEWYRGEWCINNVTHWQPLPQLPGGAK